MSHPVVNAIRIRQLKGRARKLYIAYQKANGHLDCGHHLADHITGGRRQRLAAAFNATLDRLESLGASPPSERL